MATQSSSLNSHRIVSHQEWLAARTAFLAKEKEFTRLRDELSQQRRELPWEAVTKTNIFDGPNGKQTLSELFEGKSQLIVYHFMFDPACVPAREHKRRWADGYTVSIVQIWP